MLALQKCMLTGDWSHRKAEGASRSPQRTELSSEELRIMETGPNGLEGTEPNGILSEILKLCQQDRGLTRVCI